MGATRTRALIVDDEPPARARSRQLLEAEPGVTVIGEAGSAEEARARMRDARPDVLFLDIEMPETRGTTLAAKLAAQPILPPEDVKAILEGLMAGLVYAHNRGVVHRDLKPENLMLTENGVLEVMDFGLARGEGSGKLTRTGTAMGTPAYMAPEQIQDQPFDARTDQYAGGMIVYQMLAGRLPFEGDDIMKLLFAQVSQKPEPPSQYNPRLPDEVDAVVLRMLEKRREDRFATSEEAAQWLFQALEGYR